MPRIIFFLISEDFCNIFFWMHSGCSQVSHLISLHIAAVQGRGMKGLHLCTYYSAWHMTAESSLPLTMPALPREVSCPPRRLEAPGGQGNRPAFAHRCIQLRAHCLARCKHRADMIEQAIDTVRWVRHWEVLSSVTFMYIRRCQVHRGKST